MNRRNFAKKLFGGVAGLLGLAAISQAKPTESFKIGDRVSYRNCDIKYIIAKIESRAEIAKRLKWSISDLENSNWITAYSRSGGRIICPVTHLVKG